MKTLFEHENESCQRTARLTVVSRGGTRAEQIEVNGVDLRNYTRALTIDMGTGSLHTAKVEVACLGGLDVSLDAAVVVEFALLPAGYELEKTEDGSGAVRYRAVRGDRLGWDFTSTCAKEHQLIAFHTEQCPLCVEGERRG